MFRQTIALFQYQLLSVVNGKLAGLLLVFYLLVFLAGQFAAELAIINSEQLAPALQAELVRYGLVVILVVLVCSRIASDYRTSHFERLLSMPVSRLQYIVAQYLFVLACVSLAMLPGLALLWLVGDSAIAMYWFVALVLELLLVGQFALLAAISLENLPAAVLLALGLYLLARLAPVLDLVFAQSAPFYQDEQDFQLMHWIFEAIRFILPDARVFAHNDQLFEQADVTDLLGSQLIALLVYSAFIAGVLLVDFYRKEFNRT